MACLDNRSARPDKARQEGASYSRRRAAVCEPLETENQQVGILQAIQVAIHDRGQHTPGSVSGRLVALLALSVLLSAHAEADMAKCKKPDGGIYVGPSPPEGCVIMGSYRSERGGSAPSTSGEAERSAPATAPSTAGASGASASERTGLACLEASNAATDLASGNTHYVEITWKVDLRNSCAQPYNAGVTFAIYDASDYLLAQDYQRVYVPAHEAAKARGLFTTSYEKAKRLKRADASVALR
jgi:hypothetical protein